MRVVIPPVLFLICLTLMALLRWVWPVTILFPLPWALMGILPITIGSLSRFLGVYQFRSTGTNIRPFREADKMVTTGPYRYTRNPMYLGIGLALMGVWILMGALTPLVGVVIFVVTADRWYIKV